MPAPRDFFVVLSVVEERPSTAYADFLSVLLRDICRQTGIARGAINEPIEVETTELECRITPPLRLIEDGEHVPWDDDAAVRQAARNWGMQFAEPLPLMLEDRKT